MRKIRLACVVAVFSAATAASSLAQTFKAIFTFDGTDGANGRAALIQGIDGNFYGTTENQGYAAGTLFKITPNGKLTTVYNFCSQANCADGADPFGAVVQTATGDLYGTTYSGGANNNSGSVFKITAGKLTTLYSFCALANCADGEFPLAGLVLGADGNFYGTTDEGGTQNGTIFKITPAGKFTTLYTFCPGKYPCLDGAAPAGRLVQASNGNFYGTTQFGGSQEQGVVFEITPAGKFTTLYSFCSLGSCTDGRGPFSGLVQGRNGNLYGTTLFGGLNCDCGTVYEISLTGKLTSLYKFCAEINCNDGLYPLAGVIQATDGNLYGTASQGGDSTYPCYDGTETCGVVFKLTPQGTFSKLYNFCSQTGCTDGGIPLAGLLQATDGTFYGATYLQGDSGCSTVLTGCGTIFTLSQSLGPFVTANPGFGKVGNVVDILGNNLSGTTSVRFAGTAAKFKVISGNYIKAQVPGGAKTGKIKVTTSNGSLLSNVPFEVVP